MCSSDLGGREGEEEGVERERDGRGRGSGRGEDGEEEERGNLPEEYLF